MEEVFDQIETLGKIEKRVAMATLVATRGTSPKKEGAKMWVGERGAYWVRHHRRMCRRASDRGYRKKRLASFEPRLLSIAWAKRMPGKRFHLRRNHTSYDRTLDLTDPEDHLIALYRSGSRRGGKGKARRGGHALESPSSSCLRRWTGAGTLGEGSSTERRARRR